MLGNEERCGRSDGHYEYSVGWSHTPYDVDINLSEHLRKFIQSGRRTGKQHMLENICTIISCEPDGFVLTFVSNQKNGTGFETRKRFNFDEWHLSSILYEPSAWIDIDDENSDIVIVRNHQRKAFKLKLENYDDGCSMCREISYVLIFIGLVTCIYLVLHTYELRNGVYHINDYVQTAKNRMQDVFSRVY